jgi:hypothetical protein
VGTARSRKEVEAFLKLSEFGEEKKQQLFCQPPQMGQEKGDPLPHRDAIIAAICAGEDNANAEFKFEGALLKLLITRAVIISVLLEGRCRLSMVGTSPPPERIPLEVYQEIKTLSIDKKMDPDTRYAMQEGCGLCGLVGLKFYRGVLCLPQVQALRCGPNQSLVEIGVCYALICNAMLISCGRGGGAACVDGGAFDESFDNCGYPRIMQAQVDGGNTLELVLINRMAFKCILMMEGKHVPAEVSMTAIDAAAVGP